VNPNQGIAKGFKVNSLYNRDELDEEDKTLKTTGTFWFNPKKLFAGFSSYPLLPHSSFRPAFGSCRIRALTF
jgi:hypothetical protein